MAAPRASSLLLLLLLVLLAPAASARPSSSPAPPLSAAATATVGAAGALVALVLVLVLCLQWLTGRSSGNTTSMPPLNNGSGVAPQPAPVSPAAAPPQSSRGAVQVSTMYEAVDGEDDATLPSIYGAPLPQPQQAQPQSVFEAQAPTQNADAPFFERSVNAEGRLTFRGISLAEAEAVMARGGQVFKRPDRAEPGQDIYEALPSSGDLYAQVSKPGAGAGAGAIGDLYSVPVKKRNVTQPAAAAGPPPVSGVRRGVVPGAEGGRESR